MDKTLRTASTGLSAQQKYIEIISNNLANVNNYGFKKVRPEFQDLLYETMKTVGNVQRSGIVPVQEVQIGSGVELVATTRQFTPGDITATNNQFDMAINGEGFFIIRRPDNSFGFTRDGSFVRDRNGQMVTSQGFILEPGIMIPDNAQQVNISRDGVVNVIIQGSVEEQTLGQIQLARFVNPAGLRSLGENVFVETVASGPAVFEQPGINNTGDIIQSYIESSNVDLVQEMVNMIVAQRAYEINSKSVQTADTILGTAVQLKR